jgi:hypothetical protein
VREASVAALKEFLWKEGQGDNVVAASMKVGHRHFETAFHMSAPSVAKSDEALYNQMKAKLRTSRGHVTEDKHSDN